MMNGKRHKSIEELYLERGIDPETGLTAEDYKKAWDMARPTFKEGTIPVGRLIMGTSLDGDNNIEEWKSIFMNPENYGFQGFDNIWEEGKAERLRGFFIPASENKGDNLTGQEYYDLNINKIKLTEKPNNMKTYKEIVRKIVEEVNKEVNGKLKVVEKTFDNKTNPRSVIEIMDGKSVVLKVENEGIEPKDIEAAYGQALKTIAIAGLRYRKEMFDSGTWAR